MDHAYAFHAQTRPTETWHLNNKELSDLALLPSTQIQADVLTRVERARSDIDRLLRLASTVERKVEIQRLRGAICDLLFIHNATAPLHVRFPVEILVEIFSQIFPGQHRDIRATHVCHIWRTFIHRTPVFWTQFLGAPRLYVARRDSDYQILSAFISRTANRTYGLSLLGRNITILDTTNLLARLGSLSIAFRIRHLPSVHRFLKLHMPQLVKLSLQFYCDRDFIYVPVFLLRGTGRGSGDNFPRLRHLSTNGMFFPAYLASKTITHLELSDCSDYCEYHLPSEIRPRSTSHLLRNLEKLPLLEKLKISRCAPDDIVDGGYTLDLPRLRECTIEDEDWNYADETLSCFTYPPDTHLTFECHGVTLLDIATCPRLTSRLSTMDHLSLKVARDRYNFPCCYLQASKSGTERLSISVTDFPMDIGASDMGGDFVQLFNATESAPIITSLDILFEEPLAISYSQWTSILESLPSLRTLQVRAESCREFLIALRSERAAAGLERLSISCADWCAESMEALVTAIDLRASRDSKVAELTLGRVPGSTVSESDEEQGLSVISEELLTRLRRGVSVVHVLRTSETHT